MHVFIQTSTREKDGLYSAHVHACMYLNRACVQAVCCHGVLQQRSALPARGDLRASVWYARPVVSIVGGAVCKPSGSAGWKIRRVLPAAVSVVAGRMGVCSGVGAYLFERGKRSRNQPPDSYGFVHETPDPATYAATRASPASKVTVTPEN